MARSTYRCISKTSTVDESLFGYNKPGTTRATSSNTVETVSYTHLTLPTTPYV